MNKKNWITTPCEVTTCTFYRAFESEKEIKNATIRITSMGWYNLLLNGQRIDKTAFAPGWTDFNKRVQYQEYEINIKKGLNEIKVDLGEGWGGSKLFAWSNYKHYTYFPISLNLEIEKDGQVLLVSDTSFEVRSNEIELSGVYQGERQDYRREVTKLGMAAPIEISSDIIPQEGAPIVFAERIPGKELIITPKGETVIDFGQNFAGIIEATITAKEGEKLTYVPAEALDKDGNFYRDNYRACESTFSFVLKDGEQTVKPRFSFLGGRYIKLIECPKNVKAEDFTAVLIHTDMKQTCFFECENPKIQRLYLNTYYGMLSNYIDVPTDCPQRDERLGWTADAQVFCSTGAIHFDTEVFFKKWLHDMILDQREDGAVNAIIPLIGNNCAIYSIGWGDAATVVPWEIYKAFGNKKLLEECVPMMEKWCKFLLSNEKDNGTIELPFCFGDWLGLDKIQNRDYPGLTRFDLLSTAYNTHSLDLTIKAKEALGLNASFEKKQAKDLREAYKKEFIIDGHMNGKKATMFCDQERTAYTQTALAITLNFNMCDEKDRASLAKDLADLVHECGDRLSTGFLGTPELLSALSDNGYKDVAYNVLLQEAYPSWLYSVNRGATTMWEHYDSIHDDGSFADPHMNSFNHYAYGAVFSWIFANSVGIRLVEPEYRKIRIEPIADKRLGGIDCTYKSRQGDIRVKWHFQGEEIVYKIDVPSGIKAEIVLPGMENIVSENGCSLTHSYKQK
ncbi:MAG: glycoside hydrolase family 78 protein [Bacilli bacterium]|nr:glycoside hydrolase family 78 protein [Bacilli bacterium]